MLKKELRSEIRKRKKQFSPVQLQEMSRDIIDRMMSHPKVIEAKTILIYYSMPDEVCTHDVIEYMIAEEKRVILPKVIDDENMELRLYTGKQDLQESSYHIMEPSGKTFKEYKEIDVAIIPGMAFDKSNNRLGRGKGYYDRFLRSAPYIYRIGVCFDFQKLESIPTDIYDIKMNEVL